MVYLAGKVAPGHRQVHMLFSGVYCGVGKDYGGKQSTGARPAGIVPQSVK